MVQLLYFKEEKSSFSLVQYFILKSPYLISISFMEVKGWVGEGELPEFGKKKMFNYLHFKIETTPFHLPPLLSSLSWFLFPLPALPGKCRVNMYLI